MQSNALHEGRKFQQEDTVVGSTRGDIGAMKAWKSGVSFEKYVKREKLVIDGMPIESGSERYIQNRNKKKARDYHTNRCYNHFINIKAVSPSRVNKLRN